MVEFFRFAISVDALLAGILSYENVGFFCIFFEDPVFFVIGLQWHREKFIS